MADETREGVDFWEELDEAEKTVAHWPAWQRDVDAGVRDWPDVDDVLEAVAASPVVVSCFN